ncbi:hypothetical protein BS78_01G075700 [Paspalum vaginatum]|nr:hypothetical protein BS78_01G075700 [Paspalum vaginatum]
MRAHSAYALPQLKHAILALLANIATLRVLHAEVGYGGGRHPPFSPVVPSVTAGSLAFFPWVQRRRLLSPNAPRCLLLGLLSATPGAPPPRQGQRISSSASSRPAPRGARRASSQPRAATPLPRRAPMGASSPSGRPLLFLLRPAGPPPPVPQAGSRPPRVRSVPWRPPRLPQRRSTRPTCAITCCVAGPPILAATELPPLLRGGATTALEGLTDEGRQRGCPLLLWICVDEDAATQRQGSSGGALTAHCANVHAARPTALCPYPVATSSLPPSQSSGHTRPASPCSPPMAD